jgi:hypothetical protein
MGGAESRNITTQNRSPPEADTSVNSNKRIIILTVPHAACFYYYNADITTHADLVKVAKETNQILEETEHMPRVCDRRALVAAIELKLAIERTYADMHAVIVANRTTVREVGDANRYGGAPEFQQHVAKVMREYKDRVLLNIDVHSFPSKTDTHDVLYAYRKANVYFLTATGHEMGWFNKTALSYVERQGSDINLFLTWFPERYGVHSIIVEFFENTAEYTPLMLQQDVARIAAWCNSQL